GGGDGGSSGFDWPLTMKSATFFIQHPVTQGITRLHGDCGANFSVDQNWRVIGREQRDGTPLLSVRELGNGRIVLWYAQRSFRNPGGSGNVYESDIGREQNRQFFRNAFTWLKNSPNTIVERGAFPYDGILVQTPYGSEFYASSRGVTRDCGRNISACEAVPDILPDYHKVLEVNEPLEIFKSFSRKDVGTRQDITYPLTVKFDESMIKEIKPPDLSTSVFTVASPDVYIIEIKGQTYSVKDKDWYSSHVGSLTQWGVHCPNETAPCYLYGTYENGKWAALTNVRPPSTSQIYVEVEGPARMFYDISRSYEQRGDYTSAVAWRAAGTIIQVLYEYYRAR
ncbi:hypothetical protein MUP77_16480, partial [Candidatus Bathyarchaeota archaeon]|nr:hypothetical protein [Candidatus Bathyarchaeota archaeon]